jgi:hypothetical protein
MGQGHYRNQAPDMQTGRCGVKSDIAGYIALLDIVRQFLIMGRLLDKPPLLKLINYVSHIIQTLFNKLDIYLIKDRFFSPHRIRVVRFAG